MLIPDFKILERLLKPVEIRNIYHFKPLEGFSIDSRSIIKGEAFIAIRGRYYDGHSFIKRAVKKGTGLIIAERYISVKPRVPFFIVHDTCQALKSLAAYIRKKKKPFVYAVTGSLGKTTTKEMLAYLLAPYFKILKNQGTENNLLGVSKTCFSLRDEEVMILELGTNRKGEIETLSKIAAPDVGIITCVKPVHLEGLESLAGVFEEKISLLKSNSRMKLILNRDDPYLARVRRPGPVRSTKVTGRKNKTSNGVYWFGRDRNNYLFARMVKRSGGNSFFLIQDKYKLLLPSYAEGFIANVLAAIAGAKIKGVALAESAQRLGYFNNFSPLRMEQSGHKGFSILNDAYNANPYSFQMAFRGLKNCSLKKIAVIGDMLELGKKSKYYHELLAGQIIKSGFEYCLTLGKHTLCLNRKLRDLGCRKAFHFSSHRAIARFINKQFGRDAENKKRYLIFLKGSRKMELEKVIKYLR